jgi:hypothetical protein
VGWCQGRLGNRRPNEPGEPGTPRPPRGTTEAPRALCGQERANPARPDYPEGRLGGSPSNHRRADSSSAHHHDALDQVGFGDVLSGVSEQWTRPGDDARGPASIARPSRAAGRLRHAGGRGSDRTDHDLPAVVASRCPIRRPRLEGLFALPQRCRSAFRRGPVRPSGPAGVRPAPPRSRRAADPPGPTPVHPGPPSAVDPNGRTPIVPRPPGFRPSSPATQVLSTPGIRTQLPGTPHRHPRFLERVREILLTSRAFPA